MAFADRPEIAQDGPSSSFTGVEGAIDGSAGPVAYMIIYQAVSARKLASRRDDNLHHRHRDHRISICSQKARSFQHDVFVLFKI